MRVLSLDPKLVLTTSQFCKANKVHGWIHIFVSKVREEAIENLKEKCPNYSVFPLVDVSFLSFSNALL